MKLKKHMIAEEWSEESSGDGYWIALKSGYRLADDFVHAIHEDTRKAAHVAEVVICDCDDCKKDLLSQVSI